MRPVVSDFIAVILCQTYLHKFYSFFFLLDLTLLPIYPGLISPTVQHMDKHSYKYDTHP